MTWSCSTAKADRRWKRASPMPAASARDLPALGRRRACRSRSRAGCSRACTGRCLASTARSLAVALACLLFLRNCTPERFARNKARMQRIAHYSKACLVELREETGIAYDHGSGRRAAGLSHRGGARAAGNSARVLAEFGVAHRIVDAREAMVIEPALRDATSSWRAACIFPMTRPATATSSPGRSPSCCRRRGVTFKFNTTVECLQTRRRARDGVITDRGPLRCGRTMWSRSASEAPRLLRPVGIDLPIYPVKGYSVTHRHRGGLPGAAILGHGRAFQGHDDPARRRACAPRVWPRSPATIASIRPSGPATVLRSLREFFPHAARDRGAAAETVNAWAGLRPMTPDGPPYLGATPFRNVFLDLGQGSNGWTQACGCGQVVADIVSGRRPDIDLEGFGVDR